MDAYEVHDGRFVQDRQFISAADALVVNSAAVPVNKVWTIIGLGYFPNTAETKIIVFSIGKLAGAFVYPITVPVSIALSTARGLPGLQEGMEIKLFPGEYISVNRDSATAGSTMILNVRYLETDLPYYEYVDPMSRVVSKKRAHGSVYRTTGGLSMGSGGAGPHSLPGGGRGGSEPI